MVGTNNTSYSLLPDGHNDYSSGISDFVAWCDESYLCLNVSNEKDLSIELAKKAFNYSPPSFTMKLLNLLAV